MSTTLAGEQPPGPANPGLTPQKLSHAAWVTHDVEATTDFYARILGMTLCSTVIGDRIPSTGDEMPYFHLFFRLQDGSTIAFFEAPGLPPRDKPSHEAYNVFDHFAMQATDHAEVDRWKSWLTQNGVDVLGPTNHDGLIYSIYFRDPNGLRLEITAHTDPLWNRHEEQAARDVADWAAAKRVAASGTTTLREEILRLAKRE